ncbi:MAG: hypothetical protein U0P81_11930 [Holophagaceae bacterium]
MSPMSPDPTQGVPTEPAGAPAFPCAGCSIVLPAGQGRVQPDGRILCESCHHRRHRQRVCAACGAAVPRKDCHRNRNGEYICRACQAAGVKRTLRGTVRRKARPLALRILNALIFAVLGLLAVRFVMSALRQWDTPMAPAHQDR